MQFNGLLQTFPSHVKLFITAFVVVLTVGYVTGLTFVSQTDSDSPNGIEENYLGNEEVEDAQVMKFEKGAREMLTIIHTHILSMSFIFFLLGSLVAMTSLPRKLKSFLMVEPFVSILLTFGGIWLLWMGYHWMKYIVMFSGILMTAVYFLGVLAILRDLVKKPNQ
ncbi:hypothetical protein [Patiriisocius marinus]|uniref:Uncharacterized protein n=1 Tax=Patiriisocius marinus TaxID=1397112 RepID=A0A5J4J4G0_9FLAO|nr:hypothetical protein [Patiriisocius marinus]GER60918.1 hypothetical protein ULMA_30260 [Patiriisocius marinus]